ncbi:MAG: hypothetical protein EAZ09_16990 [Oscillatoriales cyanobacterium]|nr:MAG: hypothetical protein EAZ18_16310 [Oscillatoriales cyanobacterium]TAH19059.1 MAG: hypothetical protein EAZ09_16990 [Oscillatoriales cyanobacterium]
MRLGRMLPHHAKTTSPKLNVQQRSNLIMIQDPEKEPEGWDEPILADNPKQAKQECQKRADRYQVELESVTQPRKVENRPQVYRCNYKEKE